MAASPSYHVFVGAETGLLKGVNTSEKYFRNLNSINGLDRQHEIMTMAWSDANQTEIICGLKNRLVTSYALRSNVFSQVLNVEGGEGPIRGLAKYHDRYVTCVESGLVKVWKSNEKQEEEADFLVGGNVSKMKQNPQHPSLIATGGKENDLKLWDLQNTKVPVFRAKNVGRDFLDHRVPVWVTDLQFVPDSKRVVLCTGHHHIRLYDPNTPQKRPVINLEFDEYPLTAISLTSRENLVIAGNSRGRMALFDLRRKLLVHSFKGFAGSIRSIECHSAQPLVASCGLDRFLRVHHVDTHKLLHKAYLKSRLNCLLVLNEPKADAAANGDSTPKAGRDAKGAEVIDDRDELWESLAPASDDENDDGSARKALGRRKRKLRTTNGGELDDCEKLRVANKKKGKKTRNWKENLE